MKNIRLSVVLATYNEEKNIGDCLASVSHLADEMVVIDGSSIDQTRKISKRLGARVFKVSNKLMFHQNKQLSLEKATGDWILQLDADERVSKRLAAEIKKEIKSHGFNGYFISRKNYFLGKWLRKGGQYPDYVVRLIKKGKAHFPCKTVHEQIEVKGEIGYLKNPLFHLANPNLSSYFCKANIYTTETALKLKKGANNYLFLGFNYLFVKPIFTFVSLFIRHKGFIDGWRGFLFALFSAFHFPWAFIKYLKIKNRK